MTIFVSLIETTDQLIPPNTYTALRFGSEESYDPANWHAVTDLQDPASALIVPSVDIGARVALVAGMVHWAAAPPMNQPTQYLARITRDPYGELDSTATHDRAPTPGGQYDVFSWPMFIRYDQPLALMVAHNGPTPLAVTLAEFKVWVP